MVKEDAHMSFEMTSEIRLLCHTPDFQNLKPCDHALTFSVLSFAKWKGKSYSKLLS